MTQDIKTNMVGDAMDWILGKTNKPSEPVKAAVLSGFPSREDALDAQKNGFGYGTQYGGYVEGTAGARVLNTSALQYKTLPALMNALSDKTASKIVNDPEKTLSLTRAALAANRNPVAALGFDPRHITLSNDGNLTIAGAYKPGSDSIWAAADDAATLVHESMHRGLEILRKERPDLKETIDKLGKEEYVVRYMMYKYAGDPEGGGGSIDKQQRQTGIQKFEKSGDLPVDNYAENNKNLQTILDAAQDVLNTRAHKGPA